MLRFSFLFLIFLIIGSIYILDSSLYSNLIEGIFNCEKLNEVIWLIVLFCFFIHWYSIKNQLSYSSGIIYKNFGLFADHAFSAVTFGIALTTSITILKGVYFQKFATTPVVYFLKFENIDIYSLMVVCSFLVFYSLQQTIKVLIDGYKILRAAEIKPTTN